MSAETIYTSFYLTYAFLMTTAAITFIEALRTNDMQVRTIMNLETCISFVATFFYSLFLLRIKDNDYAQINLLRYADWCITTPLMILVLITSILHVSFPGGSINVFFYFLLVCLNYGMLGFGYLGDTHQLDKTVANALGFGCYSMLFGLIYFKYVRPKYNFSNYIIFFAYVLLWGMYGLVYFLDEKSKNVAYNVLDLISKALIGILLWAFYTRVLSI